MKNKLLDKRIPTLLGILLIIIGVGLTSFLVSRGIIFKSNASPSQEPQNIKVTNVSDTSFSVTYITSDNVFGSVNYGASPSLGQTALDDRDSLSRSVVPHRVHSISVDNLDPSTTYYFSITSAESKYDNGNKPFTVTTGPQIESSPSSQNPASGKVILPDGTPPTEALVYLFSTDSEVASTLLKSDGSYLIPLNSLRSSDFSSYASLSATTKLKIIVSGNTQTSSVTINASQINPVPKITLSNNYDFSNSQTTNQTQASPVASTSGFPTADQAESVSPTITSPKSNEGFSDSQPEFSGTAQPNETVEITIHSDSAITTTVTSDSNGNWTYRPNQALTPGNHTITIQSKDASGIVKTITQSFTVFAEGSQFSTSPGPTGFSSPSPIPTLPPSPTPSSTPPPTPVITAIPTLVPTSTPVFVEASPVSSSSPESTLPPTGFSSIPLGLFGTFLAISGSIIFIYSRRSLRT